MRPEFPVRPFKTYGGIRLPAHRTTAREKTVTMPAPEICIIPLRQSSGAPCRALVKKGDRVWRGQKIGDTEEPFAVPVHASVSGTVLQIAPTESSSGEQGEAIWIQSDGKMESLPNLRPPIVTNAAGLAAAIRESGLVGPGCEGLPTHIKFNPPRQPDTLIINAIESEPYLTCAYRCALEESRSVLEGVYAIKSFLNVHRVIIAVEENKPEAAKILGEIADNEEYDPDDEVRILLLPSVYPQGEEKNLIKACTDREVPPGKLPGDVGCIVMTIDSVVSIAKYLKTGMPLVSKRITVSGSAIFAPANVLVPIGARISDIIEFCGGFSAEPGNLLVGGPVSGKALRVMTAPIVKADLAILAFAEKDSAEREESACIRCGRCVRVCPMRLAPALIEKAAAAGDLPALRRLHADACTFCGACACVCPANRRLTDAIRRAAALLRAETQAQKSEAERGKGGVEHG